MVMMIMIYTLIAILQTMTISTDTTEPVTRPVVNLQFPRSNEVSQHNTQTPAFGTTLLTMLP